MKGGKISVDYNVSVEKKFTSFAKMTMCVSFSHPSLTRFSRSQSKARCISFVSGALLMKKMKIF